MKRHALQQVAERHANHQRRHEAAEENAPVPQLTPAHIFDFRAVVKTDRAEEKRGQHQNHRHIEAGKGRRIDHWPGGEQRAAGGDQPHLVAVPVRRDTVNHDAAFGIGATQNARQHSHAHIETVGDREANQQHADQQPPDKTYNFIIQHSWLLYCIGCEATVDCS